MNDDEYLSRIFSAHTVLVRHHVRHGESEEVRGDLRRAETMRWSLSQRFAPMLCLHAHRAFLESLRGLV